MKKFIILPLAFVLTLSVMTGCRRNVTPENTSPSTNATVPTTMPTVPPTTIPPTMPSTTMTEPDMGDILPGTEDTIDPTNGANQGPAGF